MVVYSRRLLGGYLDDGTQRHEALVDRLRLVHVLTGHARLHCLFRACKINKVNRCHNLIASRRLGGERRGAPRADHVTQLQANPTVRPMWRARPAARALRRRAASPCRAADVGAERCGGGVADLLELQDDYGCGVVGMGRWTGRRVTVGGMPSPP